MKLARRDGRNKRPRFRGRTLSPKTFNSYMDLKFYLEEVFGVPVDLVLSDTIKPVLRDTILGEAVHAEGFRAIPARHSRCH